MKPNSLTAAVIFTFFVLSCNTTRVNSSWKAADHQPKTYHNIMVWGLLSEKDSTTRHLMETHLVNDLVAEGLHAVSSADVYKLKAYKKLTAGEIIEEFKNTGVDAVITIALLSKEKEEKYYPGGFYNQPANANINPGLDHYSSGIYERVYSPGYYITTTTYFWESSLFDVKQNRMVYSVQTKSFDPNTTETLAHENGLTIIRNMVKKKVLPGSSPKED